MKTKFKFINVKFNTMDIKLDAILLEAKLNREMVEMQLEAKCGPL